MTSQMPGDNTHRAITDLDVVLLVTVPVHGRQIVCDAVPLLPTMPPDPHCPRVAPVIPVIVSRSTRTPRASVNLIEDVTELTSYGPGFASLTSTDVARTMRLTMDLTSVTSLKLQHAIVFTRNARN